MKRTLSLLAMVTALTLTGCLPWSMPQRPALLQAVVADPDAFRTDPPSDSVPATGLAALVGCWGSVQQDGPVTTSLALMVDAEGATELAWDVSLAGVVSGVVVQRGRLEAVGDGRFDLLIETVETSGPGGPATEDAAPASLPWRVRTGAGLLGVEFVNAGGPEATAGRTLWFRRSECVAP